LWWPLNAVWTYNAFVLIVYHTAHIVWLFGNKFTLTRCALLTTLILPVGKNVTANASDVDSTRVHRKQSQKSTMSLS